jgi:hypothetical protein
MRDKIILGFKTSIAPLRGVQPTPANCETAIKYLNYWATILSMSDPTLDFKQARIVLKAATMEAI